LITLGRLLIAIAAVFFGVEHFLHSQFVPVVPLGKLMPTWYPGHLLIAYVTGAVLIAAGVSLLLGKRTRAAATSIGILAVAAVLLVYLPIAIATDLSIEICKRKIQGVITDSLLFAGMVLVLANALPKAEQAR
jgi:uncharacterized membrane protein